LFEKRFVAILLGFQLFNLVGEISTAIRSMIARAAGFVEAIALVHLL
tara:strand:- start:115148 stop:115288 length:141 start_codon:yes stop_codon:yes gene_type:complete